MPAVTEIRECLFVYGKLRIWSFDDLRKRAWILLVGKVSQEKLTFQPLVYKLVKSRLKFGHYFVKRIEA